MPKPQINARTQFYLNNPNFIISVARKHQIPESDIEDFSQQVLLESLQHRCRRHKTCSIESYAEGYVLLQIAAYKQKQRNVKHVDMSIFPARTPPADRILETTETWQDIKEQIKDNGYKITPRQNEVMELLATGMSQKQVAKTLDISIVRITTIRKQIKRKLEKNEKKRGRKRKNY